MMSETAIVGISSSKEARLVRAERKAARNAELAAGIGAPWPFAPLRAGQFHCIEADPPWLYRVFSKKGEGRAAVRHYPTMKLDAIKALPVGRLAARDCHLFLWTTGPNLRQAFDVMEAWGFAYSSVAFTWVKLNPRQGDALFLCDRDFHVGMGHTTRKNAEFCLLGRRGSPKRLSKAIRELIISPRREHSRKPDEAYRRIVRYAAGPRCALFAREARPGFEVWGLESTKFDAEAA